jgi:O-antigen/teichoic acid export membrane protein
VFLYTKNVVGATLLGLLLHNAGYIIAGHVTDTHWAGLYNVAATNAMFVVINYAWLIGNVSLSGFAVKQDDPETLRYAFGRVFEILAATTLPVHLMGIALAPLIFTAVLPSSYLPSIATFQVLLGFAAVRALAGHVAPFFNAIDRSDINLKFYVVSTPLCLAAMYAACRYAKVAGGDDAAILALAWATALSQGVSVLAWLALVPRTLAWRRAGLIQALAPYGVAAVLAVAVAKGASLALDQVQAPALVNLVSATALGGLFYLVALYTGARTALARLVYDIVPIRLRERYVYTLLPSLDLKRNASVIVKP